MAARYTFTVEFRCDPSAPFEVWCEGVGKAAADGAVRFLIDDDSDVVETRVTITRG